MGRVESDKKKVLDSIWSKVLCFTKEEFFENIHYWHSALMTVPFDHSKYHEKSLVWIMKTMHTKLWAKA